MTRIAVLDFGMGNLRSVAKALEKAGAVVDVVSEVPASADGLVVPGQGHFGSCITNLGPRAKDVSRWIEDGRPYLGICLGLQILFESSDEAAAPALPGLGIFRGLVRRFAGDVKVPHIGWNQVHPVRDHPIFDGIAPDTRFYFVHSYYPDPDPDPDPDTHPGPGPASGSGDVTLATTGYGLEFCSAAARANVVATQFHPEKSGRPGIRLLQNFIGTCA